MQNAGRKPKKGGLGRERVSLEKLRVMPQKRVAMVTQRLKGFKGLVLGTRKVFGESEGPRGSKESRFRGDSAMCL